jgi:hypothetical protein
VSYVIPLGAEILTFTMPSADGVMYVNGEPCYANGRLAGIDRFIIGHRPLRDAAQWWFLERSHLVNSYAQMFGREYPFMEKESDNASQEEDEEDQGEERPQGKERSP